VEASVISRVLGAVRRRGLLGSVRAATDVLVVMPVRRSIRRRSKPSLKELVRATVAIEVRAEDLLAHLGHHVRPDLGAEADERVAELERRTAAIGLLFPERFAVERESGRFLYLLVRLVRPALMVETGVANGASTFLVLSAMKRNGVGRLVSVDVTPDVGVLVSEDDHSPLIWDLRVIEPGRLEPLMSELGPLDLFLHDSDHSYANVVDELRAAWPRMAEGGIVMADDAELNCAFLDVAADFGARPYGLFDRRKLFMLTRA
jgi:predicted O-methyltransferase YrrM